MISTSKRNVNRGVWNAEEEREERASRKRAKEKEVKEIASLNDDSLGHHSLPHSRESVANACALRTQIHAART